MKFSHVLPVLFLGGILISGCEAPDTPDAPETREVPDSTPSLPELAPVGATLLDGLGDHHMPIGTDNPEVQQWFDQGLMLTYGFNHDAAERSFLKAIELEPECAMCWWGASLVLGPNINAPMPPEANAPAHERLQAALALAPEANEREQAYIEALSVRYTAEPLDDRSALDKAYAEAMAAVVDRYPDDLDAATLYAESLMNLQPWDFWEDDGVTATGNTPEILQVLESVMDRAPEHPGALHLYIHAVEASDGETLRRGEWAADQLRDLIPGSGHLVHMPSHIYARVGRWRDAASVNRDAIKADDLYLAICRPQPGVYPLGYVPHNHHFLWFVSSMIGDRETALDAARSTAERTSDPELMRAPGLEAMQNFAFTPVFAKVRFGLWDEIADTPRPADDLPYMNALWHYAQAVAALRQERREEAGAHHEVLSDLAEHPAFDEMMWFGRYPLTYGVRVAERIVAAEIALADGDTESAIDRLHEAIAIEDDIPYDEPPGWHHPVRQILGAVLLEAGELAEAEAVYRAELRRNPDNGWSLFGLRQALAAQDRDDEAEAIDAEFSQAWADADIELTASYF
jgi:tetratricopeptide (TPR) repeat protein